MARYTRRETLTALETIGVMPMFYESDIETAKNIVHACVNGGARSIEFLNRGDFAHETFALLEHWARKELPQAILGAGSIIDPYTAALYIQSGANFIVAPTADTAISALCNLRGIPYLPGCASATEIAAALSMGAEMVKLFPGAETGGASFIAAVKAPMPWINIMPSGGVTPDKTSLAQWFGAGAACVGMGSNLITKEIVQAGNFAALEANVSAVLKIIAELRGA